uniref:Uncharacterized protein n=1 Tax=Rhizophora mucronata TaxID=61149 RepID=A0A2P2QQX3_RHIMU
MNPILTHLLGSCSSQHQWDIDFFHSPMQFYDWYWTDSLKFQRAYHPSNILLLQNQCTHPPEAEDQTSFSSLWWVWFPVSPHPQKYLHSAMARD